jgi:ribosome-associated translation inhibitor RaiA
LRDYWAKKEARLERLLGRFPEALRDLAIGVSRQTSPDRLAVRAALHLPTRTLVAEVMEREPNAALDKLCDVLAAEIKRHRDQLRRDWEYGRKRKQTDGVKANTQRPRFTFPADPNSDLWSETLSAAQLPEK